MAQPDSPTFLEWLERAFSRFAAISNDARQRAVSEVYLEWSHERITFVDEDAFFDWFENCARRWQYDITLTASNPALDSSTPQTPWTDLCNPPRE